MTWCNLRAPYDQPRMTYWMKWNLFELGQGYYHIASGVHRGSCKREAKQAGEKIIRRKLEYMTE